MKFLDLLKAPRDRKQAARTYRPANMEAALFPASIFFGRKG
jgi:hypothetical protein